MQKILCEKILSEKMKCERFDAKERLVEGWVRKNYPQPFFLPTFHDEVQRRQSNWELNNTNVCNIL